MQSSVATCYFSSFLNFVATDFDNVTTNFDNVATYFDNIATKFWCSSLVLVAIGMYMLRHQICLQLASHVLLLPESVTT